MTPAIHREIRRSKTITRVGVDSACSCGERRGDALTVTDEGEAICYRCLCVRDGRPTRERHEPAGRRNDPFSVLIDVNDHRVLSAIQRDCWPPGVLSNRDGNPLIRASARVRGLIDTAPYVMPGAPAAFVRDCLIGIPQYLESLNSSLTDQIGPKWWRKNVR
jgi:hypothetical protein